MQELVSYPSLIGSDDIIGMVLTQKTSPLYSRDFNFVIVKSLLMYVFNRRYTVQSHRLKHTVYQNIDC